MVGAFSSLGPSSSVKTLEMTTVSCGVPHRPNEQLLEQPRPLPEPIDRVPERRRLSEDPVILRVAGAGDVTKSSGFELKHGALRTVQFTMAPYRELPLIVVHLMTSPFFGGPERLVLGLTQSLAPHSARPSSSSPTEGKVRRFAAAP